MDLIGLKLKKAFEKEGCPICRLLEEFEDSQIETVLYEHVNDPEVRKLFSESLGLCTRHAWKILQKSQSNPLLGPLGVAVIYEHVLSLYINSLKSGEDIGEGRCFLCNLLQEKETDIIEDVARRINQLIDTYLHSSSLLCRRHYRMLFKKLGEKDKKRLEEVQLEKLKTLRMGLNEFVESFDYHTDTPDFNKFWTVKRTIEALKGREVVLSLSHERKRRGRAFWVR